MISISLPNKDVVVSFWNEIEPFINKAVEESNGELTSSGILDKVKSGEILIATVFDGTKLVAAVSFDMYYFESGKKVLNIQCAGGEQVDGWFEQIEEIANELAKKNGCSSIYIIGRKGWLKKMSHLGYKHIHTVIAKEVV